MWFSSNDGLQWYRDYVEPYNLPVPYIKRGTILKYDYLHSNVSYGLIRIIHSNYDINI